MINASWLGEKSLTVGVEEVGESSWGGVGGHGLLSDTTDSFPPSKKLDDSLIGEPGCGSSAGCGDVKLLTGCLPVLSGRMESIVTERWTKNRGKLLGGWGPLVVESGYRSMIAQAQVSTGSTL